MVLAASQPPRAVLVPSSMWRSTMGDAADNLDVVAKRRVLFGLATVAFSRAVDMLLHLNADLFGDVGPCEANSTPSLRGPCSKFYGCPIRKCSAS